MQVDLHYTRHELSFTQRKVKCIKYNLLLYQTQVYFITVNFTHTSVIIYTGWLWFK